MKKNQLNLNFEIREERVAFIKSNEGIMSGTNILGEPVIVKCSPKTGMEVQTIHKEKPNWYEIIEYDVDGFQEGVRYEHV